MPTACARLSQMLAVSRMVVLSMWSALVVLYTFALLLFAVPSVELQLMEYWPDFNLPMTDVTLWTGLVLMTVPWTSIKQPAVQKLLGLSQDDVEYISGICWAGLVLLFAVPTSALSCGALPTFGIFILMNELAAKLAAPDALSGVQRADQDAGWLPVPTIPGLRRVTHMDSKNLDSMPSDFWSMPDDTPVYLSRAGLLTWLVTHKQAAAAHVIACRHAIGSGCRNQPLIIQHVIRVATAMPPCWGKHTAADPLVYTWHIIVCHSCVTTHRSSVRHAKCKPHVSCPRQFFLDGLAQSCDTACQVHGIILSQTPTDC